MKERAYLAAFAGEAGFDGEDLALDLGFVMAVFLEDIQQ